ncbi:hypothetical protein ONJ95_26360, partial [Salmonella enterica subsp. enterica serovar Virginia]|nr:hypothetical protein [Salmonella enterica subsp. enterica serovar Virginia]
APWAAAECYLACDNVCYAIKALKAVVRICGEVSEHQILRQRAVFFFITLKSPCLNIPQTFARLTKPCCIFFMGVGVLSGTYSYQS